MKQYVHSILLIAALSLSGLPLLAQEANVSPGVDEGARLEHASTTEGGPGSEPVNSTIVYPEGHNRIRPNEYGLVHGTAISLNSFAFVPFSDSATTGANGADFRWIANSSGYFEASVPLPNGVSVRLIGMQACNTSPTYSGPTFTLYGLTPGGWTAFGSVTAAANSGCGYFYTSITPFTSDTWYSNYAAQISGFNVNDGSIKFNGVRVVYYRQISSAPSTPSFADVPNDGSIFYQSVEALKSSGITAGCDATHFCPNESVSRLQMAVFLARALGLDWPE